MRALPVFAAASLAAASLAACALVDQRTFDPHAGEKPMPPVVAAKPLPAGPPPLVEIVFATPDPPYEEEVANAVRRALARRADAIFTVQVLVPVRGDPPAQAEQARQGAATARRIAQAIVEAGADPGQIETAVRADPARPVEKAEIRVR